MHLRKLIDYYYFLIIFLILLKIKYIKKYIIRL